MGTITIAFIITNGEEEVCAMPVDPVFVQGRLHHTSELMQPLMMIHRSLGQTGNGIIARWGETQNSVGYWLCVCVCVCMHVCVLVCVRMCVYLRMHMCMHVCVYVCVC